MKIVFGFLLSVAFNYAQLLFAQEIPSDSLYLGQTPPGNTPKVFNLPITNRLRPLERIAISSNGKEIYFGEINTYPPTSLRVRCFKYLDNKWQGPFNAFEGFMAPKFANNDSILYLQDNSFHTYCTRRIDTGWSTPIPIFLPDVHTHYFQKTNFNNMYASTYYEGSPSDGDLCKVIFVNQDTIFQSLGIPLNSSSQENDFLIAPDESYALVSRNTPGGASDMYLSFKNAGGHWTNPKKLDAPIDKPGYNWEYGQFISSDGKYLFFTSGGLSWNLYFTYWVKIDNIIDSLRHTNFVPYLKYQIPNKSIKVGDVFSYTIPDSTFIDDDGNNTLAYSAALGDGNVLPAWLTFNSETKTFSGSPLESVNLEVMVTATDEAGASVSCTFSINSSLTGYKDFETNIPNTIGLFQNYPNPFNPLTTIGFTISKSENVSLKVYDTVGKEVKEILNGYLNAGKHSFEFDAQNISSGIYYYVLKTNTFRDQKKMIVQK